MIRSPAQRQILVRLAASAAPVQTSPRERPAAVALVASGFADLTPAGLVLTEAGRAEYAALTQPWTNGALERQRGAKVAAAALVALSSLLGGCR